MADNISKFTKPCYRRQHFTMVLLINLSRIPFIKNSNKLARAKIGSSPGNSSETKRRYPKSDMKDVNEEFLNLQPGELAKVRSKEEIFPTLDENGKNRGLFFMPEMTQFCGKEYKVFKKVERIEMESTGEMRKLKSPTVFLEGVFCDGEFHDGCDRSCFMYWREIWLKRSHE